MVAVPCLTRYAAGVQIALVVGLSLVVFGALAWLRRSAQRDTPEQTRAVLAARAAWLANNRIGLALAFGGGLIALTGIGMWAHAMTGETVDVDLARLEAGERSDAAFIRVRGVARAEHAVCRDTRGGSSCHTPLTSTPSGNATLVLVSSSQPLGGAGEFTGMVWSDDVWGTDEIAASGLSVSPDAFVLLRGETPEERRQVGLVIAACGAALALVGAFLLRRARVAFV